MLEGAEGGADIVGGVGDFLDDDVNFIRKDLVLDGSRLIFGATAGTGRISGKLFAVFKFFLLLLLLMLLDLMLNIPLDETKRPFSSAVDLFVFCGTLSDFDDFLSDDLPR